ncbi:MAG: DUF6456 domain-containing protein [Pseudomonadota bacterium]
MSHIDTMDMRLVQLPAWVPVAARNYLIHTEAGLPIRELARQSGCHASTVMRQVRKFETRRDDPLIDAVLRALGLRLKGQMSTHGTQADKDRGTMQAAMEYQGTDDSMLACEAPRILRRLCEKGAMLAVALDLDKAVVVRESASGVTTRTAVVDREVAEAMALQDWISAEKAGRITRYRITSTGRAVLGEMLEAAEHETPGFAETATPFADQHRIWGERDIKDDDTQRTRRLRYNLAESPLTALARRRDRDGQPFLSDDLVSAGERLREDFELAQMGPRIAQDWDRFLVGGGRGGFVADSGVGSGPEAARARLSAALTFLGPGLADVVLRCCCFLEGLETAEKKLGWSARSGKIVLRIALIRLKSHYEETNGPGGGLIG